MHTIFNKFKFRWHNFPWIFHDVSFFVRFLKFVKQARIFYTFSASNSSWLKKSWGFLILFSWLSFSESISISIWLNLYVDFFHFFKKHDEKNHLRHEMSTSVAVSVVLKSNFFDFKTTLTERWNNDKTTLRTIWRYLLMFTLTIAKSSVSAHFYRHCTKNEIFH